MSARVCHGVTERGKSAPEAAIPTPSARHELAAGPPPTRRSRAKRLTTVNRSTRLGKRIVELTDMFATAVSGELTPMRRLVIDQAAQLRGVAEKARRGFLWVGV